MHFMPRRLPRFIDLLASLAGRLFTRRPRKRRQLAKRPIRCWFERLEAREVFNVTYGGGALIPHVEAQAVFLGSQWTGSATLESEAAAIDNMLAYTVQSPYMDLLTDAGYNVGQGTAVTGARISVGITGTITDANIRSLLQQAINLKLVQPPTLNRLYLVYTPSGVAVNDNGATSQTTFLGYHGAFAGSDASGVPFDIHYVVVPHPGAPNPVSTSQGFTGSAEVQTLTLGGGTADGTLTPKFNGVFATTPIIRANEIQQLTVTTPANSSITLGFNSVPAPTPITPTNDFQLLTVGGTDGGTVTLSYSGVAGSAATKLTKTSGSSPTVQQVLDHLNSIPALNGNVSVTGNTGGPFTITFDGSLAGNASLLTATTAASATATINPLATVANVQASLDSIPTLTGNTQVTGSVGGPFAITFGGALADTDVSAITAITTSGGATAAITQKTNPITGTTNGNLPTAAQVLASLNAIAALNGNVSVTGSAGGPFTITIKNLGNAPSIDVVSGATGGLTASITTNTDGISGLTSDIDEMTAVTSHEMAEAVTDPNVNYKTLGWYDLANNVEIGDLTGSVADVPNQHVRLGPSGFYVQNLFTKTDNILAPDTTSIAFNAALADVQVTQISATQALVSWSSVDHGATGYRVYLVNGSAQTLLSRVPRTATSTVVTLPALSQGTLKVEAYNAVHATDLVTVPFSLDLPTVQKPVITSVKSLSPTSAQVNWTSTVPSGSQQALTLGGAGGGSFTLAYNGSAATAPLTRTDEVQTLTVGGADGGTIQLSYKGETGTTTTQLRFQAGVSPTAADVLNHLRSIAELSTDGVVQVTGPSGGPFTITFTGGLSGMNVDQLGVSVSSGATASVTTVIDGSAPTAIDVQNALVAAAPTLNGHLAVTGNAGGPYFLTVTNSSGVVLVNVNSVSGGVTAAVNGDIGAAGFRIFTLSGTTKTLVATLPGSATTATINGLPANKLVSFMVEAFRGSTRVDSAAKSVQPAPLSKPVVTLTHLSATSVRLNWALVAGAKGYRVFRLTSTGKRVLVSSLGASATSIKIGGFPTGTKFIVQAYNGSQLADSNVVS